MPRCSTGKCAQRPAPSGRYRRHGQGWREEGAFFEWSCLDVKDAHQIVRVVHRASWRRVSALWMTSHWMPAPCRCPWTLRRLPLIPCRLTWSRLAWSRTSSPMCRSRRSTALRPVAAVCAVEARAFEDHTDRVENLAQLAGTRRAGRQGGSLNFCTASRSSPHSVQRYW